ncbi:DMT family transporter [Deinococcus sp. Arct2-2]|uniref:DMT family transporter n=1 Tax=Deinococcus sp. Arct2-2 TaxID=2568653 RepID=UPI0010A42C00|nr:DMT family transporter [Deinococcus sp. Arct2-2]THF69434.1 DMT family transporter [Deinococcus sp. Arct2-2]
MTDPTVALQRRALVGVLLTVTMWGANVVLLKALLGSTNAETINVGRFVIAGSVLVALSVRAHGWPRWDATTWLAVAVVGFLGNTLFQAFFLTAIRANPAGVGGLVTGIVPVLVLPLGLLLGQKVSGRQTAGVGVAFAGLLGLLAVTLQPGAHVTLSGLGWVLAAAGAWAGYTLFNRPLTAQLGALPFVAFSLLLGCLPYLLWAVPHLHDLNRLAPLTVLGIVVSALGANVLAYLAWANGTNILGAARTAVWNTLAPAVALLLSAAVLHERLPTAVWLAAGVILLGAALANWPEQKKRAQETATSPRPEL